LGLSYTTDNFYFSSLFKDISMNSHITENPITLVPAQLTQDSVRTTYDLYSSVYDLWGGLTESNARNHAIELAGVRDGDTILDVAVGTGLMLEKIAPVNPRGKMTGIDISVGMLNKAREKLSKYPNVSLKNATAQSIPFSDNHFDTLFNSYMFDLLPIEIMPSILNEFKRVIKPGGRLVMVNMTIGEKPGSGLYEMIYKISPALMGGCRGVRLSDLLKKIGFEVVTRDYKQQFLFPSEVILAKKPKA
jgi:ubiquinone/menaquinone biosynthesis C-methylase UbiE